MSELKEYLGDGAYVDMEYGQIVLTTENGISVQNRIVLDKAMLLRLGDFVMRYTRAEQRLAETNQAKAAT